MLVYKVFHTEFLGLISYSGPTTYSKNTYSSNEWASSYVYIIYCSFISSIARLYHQLLVYIIHCLFTYCSFISSIAHSSIAHSSIAHSWAWFFEHIINCSYVYSWALMSSFIDLRSGSESRDIRLILATLNYHLFDLWNQHVTNNQEIGSEEWKLTQEHILLSITLLHNNKW